MVDKSVNIDAKRVKVWDVEDMNPYHDPSWCHRRCTMIYNVPVRLRTQLPSHLRQASFSGGSDSNEDRIYDPASDMGFTRYYLSTDGRCKTCTTNAITKNGLIFVLFFASTSFVFIRVAATKRAQSSAIRNFCI